MFRIKTDSYLAQIRILIFRMQDLLHLKLYHLPNKDSGLFWIPVTGVAKQSQRLPDSLENQKILKSWAGN